MLYAEVRRILFGLSDEGDLTLPYGTVPALDEREEVNELRWQNIRWNPPEGFPHLSEADAAASPKPSWATIEGWQDPVQFSVQTLTHRLRDECRRRITETYGFDSFRDEIELRLRGDATPEQDAERDRLRGVCRTQKARVEAMTRAERAAFDPHNDTMWAPPSQAPAT